MKKDPALIHIYCMPGMSAKPTIFEHIQLPKNQYAVHWLSWISPEKNEPIEDYSRRICKYVKHENVILLGVSLGGIVVQEMQKFIRAKQLILISTIKTKSELPAYMRLAQKTGLYKLLPTSLVKYYKNLKYLPIGKHFKKRLGLYNHYAGIYDHRYLTWAFDQLLHWERETPLTEVVHIHGDKDKIFPIKYIKNCIIIKGGTHIMIINRFRWFNQHLPDLLKDN